MSKEKPNQEHNLVQGQIRDIAYLGSHSIYHIKLQSGKKVQVQLINDIRWGNERFTWDDQVWVFWDDDSGVVLTA